AATCVVVTLLSMLPGSGPRIAHGAPALQSGARTQIVLTASGQGNSTTRAVAISGGWTLGWSYNCGRRSPHFQATAYRRGRRAPLARVARRADAGRGTLHVVTGGKVYLVIRTECAWRIAVTRLAAPAPSPTPTPSPTMTPAPGATTTSGLALRVEGNRLVNGRGQAVRLLGVNVPGSAQCIPTGPHTPPGIFAFPSATQTAAAIAGWDANVVRVTLNEDCWLGINGGDPAYTGWPYRAAVTTFVADLHAAGLYVILDLHANAPGTTPSTSQQVMADADHGIAYWTSVADTFKDDPAVIFEPYNEPHITTANAATTNPWQCWRDGCTIEELDQYHNTPIPGAAPWQGAGLQRLVDAIRATGASNPILVDGLNWSQDLIHLLPYLPNDPLGQLIADYHNYMSPASKNTPAYWDAAIAPIAARMPVMTSELGEKDCGASYVTRYMQWADQHGVSYIPWVWMTWNCGAMGLVSSWDGTPSAYGRPFYDHFHAVSLSPPRRPSRSRAAHVPTRSGMESA
ncbi:MAG: cellulase family glycosylhydrolase, partial [Chloroflexi bacterium]|nr:cellulase family glycosylhydrolase [Chloroflexota bacterium]